MASSCDGLESLQLSRDEVEKLSNALKDEKFRSLLVEYAEEITDPQNRALYQQEITQLEKERGVDVTFINPEPCYVLKTSINGEKKAFLNICSNGNVNKSSCERAVEGKDTPGYRWSIPYSLAPPKEDLDKSGRRCVVYDVVFHPDTLYLGKRNPRFKKLIEDTAMEGVEKNFKVKLDRKSIKYPKMKFKGIAIGTVVRKVGEGGLKTPKPLIDSYTIPYPDIKCNNRVGDEKTSVDSHKCSTGAQKEIDNKDVAVTPHYVIKHRKNFDLQDYTYDNFGTSPIKNSIPSHLNVEIELPQLNSAAQIDLDVNEKTLRLKSESPVKYHLEIDLPYQVDSDDSNAKFDVNTHKLCVILPVKMDNYITAHADESRADRTYESKTLADTFTNDSEVSDDVTINNSESVSEDEQIRSIQTSEKLENEVNSALEPKIAYLLPTYDLRQSDNKLVFVLHVSNVDRDSVSVSFTDDKQSCTVKFTTLGSGFVPFHYKLYLRTLNENCFDLHSFSVNVEDKNIVVILHKAGDCEWQKIKVGLDEEHLEEYELLTMASLVEKMQNMQIKYDEYSATTQATEKERISVTSLSEELAEIEIEMGIKNEQLHCDIEDKEQSEEKMHLKGEVHSTSEEPINNVNIAKNEENSMKNTNETASDSGCASPISIINPNKHWSICESTEDLNHSPSQKPRGILKLRKYSRSISESSDDFSLSSQELIASPDSQIPEESSADESGCRIKKNVRFNEVVSRNLFRSNSSILGQRKKNQRKQRTKKRAAYRRMSESEGSETENEHLPSKTQIDNSGSHDPDKKITNEETKLDNHQELNVSSKRLCTDNHENQTCTCTMDTVNANTCIDSLTSSVESVDNAGDIGENVIESFSSNDENANRESSTIENVQCVVEANANKPKSKKKRRRKTKQESDPYEPKTMLSWEDENNGENKKEYKCPVNFVNSMIFELD